MATTYKDYYIYYNGGLISSNEDTGLTTVNIYYNGTYLGEGAHTLNCSGQYMNGNVQIGNRTLNCSGQYMNGNVQVTTQARYKWQKWNSVQSYYQATTDHNISGSWMITENIWTVATGLTVYAKATGYSFDTTTGLYNMSGGQYSLSNGEYGVVCNTYEYMGYPNGSTTTTQRMAQLLSASQDEFIIQLLWSGGNLRFTGTGDKLEAGQVATTREYYTGYTWIKGSTQYTNVSSTSSGAYPTNGRASDGYWYVAI